MARLVAAAVGAAMLVAAVVSVLWLVLSTAAVLGVIYGGRWLWQQHRGQTAARARDRAQLLARADIQHRWYMAGDQRGTYGRYPPAAV